ncbi:MAG: ureidoglycolate lyase [Pseudanabaenales cyanobacterium]|nr:ureidoglycolate lyase [Pseudanabaenales cyanobacterium]
MSQFITLKQLQAEPVTPESFRPFGQVIFPSPDGVPYGPEDAQLQLQNGTPRFYIMRLEEKGRRFYQITRHRKCTQCLGALAGKEWLIAVAPANQADQPDPSAIRAFQIPGDCLIKLEVGTWHAGPHFDGQVVDFYNLELSDTNITDHQTCNLTAAYSLEYEIV